MNRGRTERETCELNGWGVGTRLVGDEGRGPTTIRITNLTEDGQMLAACESERCDHDRRPCGEHFWTLRCREWEPVL